MAQDITEQATQDELADSLVAEPEAPQPQQESDTETAEPQETESAQAEEQTEETADDYLPTEQEKVFPDDVLLKYAQRYQKDEKWLSDPLNKQLIVDKINTDIFTQSLRQQQEEQEQIEPEPEPQPEPTQQQPQLTREQYFQGLEQAINQRTDPQVAQEFYGAFMKSFGVPDADIATLAPQQAMAFTQTLSKYALNLFNTFADELIGQRLGNHLEQSYPQFGEMYQQSATARSWDSIRNEQGDTSLPAWGTPEFSTAARAIGADIAGSAERFERMTFTDAKGKPLSASDNRAEQLRLIAERMLNGGAQPPQVNPALMAQAVKTGQKIAQRQAVQKQAGNLSAGKSKQPVTGGDDDFWADGLTEYQRQHGSL